MQITGMLHGSRLLEFAGFPSTEVLGPDASEEAAFSAATTWARASVLNVQFDVGRAMPRKECLPRPARTHDG